MLGRTHAFTGLFVGLLLLPFFQVSFIERFIIVGLCIFGSLFPDIDSPTSIVGRKAKIISKTSRHRGLFHSVIPLVIAYFLLSRFIGMPYAIAFCAGFISHIVLDMITKEGIHFFPLGIHVRGPVKVGGFLEHIFLGAQLILLFIIFY